MKRVMIIVYYWPPSGGAGVQRWLKFSKYLPEYGWQPVVYTPENPDFSLKDESLLKEIHPDVEVIKRPIWEPYGFYRKLFSKRSGSDLSTGIKENKGIKSRIANWIRGNLFVPDPKVFWRKPSVNYLLDYLKENPVDALISSGTPHSMHLIALDVKKKTALPWIADFRDPWTELDMLQDYHIHPIRKMRYRALEKRVLSAADLCITASKVWAEDFRRLGAVRAECITNGFDSSDFEQEVQPYKGFILSHFGLLNHLRNPENLWKCLEDLLNANEEFAQGFKLHLGGVIDQKVLEQIRSYSMLKERMKVFPYLSHEEVIHEYRKSSMLLLLLFNSDSGRGNIPGKIFEYLASRKPILAFGPERGDSAEIVEECGGSYHRYEEEADAIKEQILNVFKGEVKLSGNIDQYSRKNLSGKLAEYLEEITAAE